MNGKIQARLSQFNFGYGLDTADAFATFVHANFYDLEWEHFVKTQEAFFVMLSDGNFVLLYVCACAQLCSR